MKTTYPNQLDYTELRKDNVAEWLRRQPAKLMGFARVGSNPTVVDFFRAGHEKYFCREVPKAVIAQLGER